MAQTPNAFGLICRSCRLTLRQARKTNRSFSTTSTRSKTLVEFAPTSSPELDQVFNQYRETLFIPSVLSEAHRRLIYRPSRRDVIVNDPGVTVTLPNDEDIRLKPMSLSDRPIKNDALRQIRESLAGSDDDAAWNNLFPFLVGMKEAKERISQNFFEQITILANEAGKHQIILKCVQQPKLTDMRLCFLGVTREILLGCHNRAVAADFQGEAFLSAAKTTQHVAFLFEKKEHCAGKLKKLQYDMRRRRFPVAVLLEMAAAKAIHLNGGKDVDGQVTSYIAKALAMPDHPFTEWVQITEKRTPNTLDNNAGRLINELPLWHGLRLAAKVDGAIPANLRQRFDEVLREKTETVESIASELQQSVEEQTKLTQRSLQMYNDLKSL